MRTNYNKPVYAANNIPLLDKMQAKMDAQGFLIAFLSYPDKNAFKDVDTIVRKAITRVADSDRNHNVPSGLPATKRVSSERHRPYQQVGSTRSLQDLYLLCKYYLPDVTIYDVRDALVRVKKENRLCSHFCSTFNRMMFKWGMSYGSSVPAYGIV